MAEYISFIEDTRLSEGKKTKVWIIHSKSSGDRLGIIKWYGAWRQYCFFPERMTIWNNGCLKDVQDFIKSEMDKRK